MPVRECIESAEGTYSLAKQFLHHVDSKYTIILVLFDRFEGTSDFRGIQFSLKQTNVYGPEWQTFETPLF